MIRGLIAGGLLALSVAALGAAELETLAPADARRAADLAAQLRCLVCQNQSIAESSAELAVDLRKQIDTQIRSGRTDREITDFMVARYGDFVLYRPPFKLTTVLLWIGPALLAGLALLAFARTVRARRARASRAALSEELSDAERSEAARLLAQDQPGSRR